MIGHLAFRHRSTTRGEQGGYHVLKTAVQVLLLADLQILILVMDNPLPRLVGIIDIVVSCPLRLISYNKHT